MLFPAASTPDEVLAAFETYCEGVGLEPYEHQIDAALALAAGDHIIITTPTGSGKSLVGMTAIAAARARGQRAYYTAPIKALVSQKFFELMAAFGPDDVGMLTGDAVINPDAPVIACTTEIVANTALRDGAGADAGVVVLDEFHYYADPERGWAWQVPLLELTNTQFVLASATLGDVTFFADDLRTRTSRDVTVITATERPVPLSYAYSMEPIADLAANLRTAGLTPAYIVHATQASAVEQATGLLSSLGPEKNPARAAAISGFRFARGFGTTLSRLLRAGIGVHHAGMLPRYRRLVERLAESGHLTIICGTDTLGVGVNIPIRTVVFTTLVKFDGERNRHLSAQEFHQIAGRAGRKGFDEFGDVIVQAPEHVIANRVALLKAGDDAKKRAKIVRKQAPKGEVNWTEATFERLRDAPPERLESRFRVTHAMILELLLGRPDPVRAFVELLDASHEPPERRGTHIRQAVRIYVSLRTAGLVERVTLPDGTRTVRLTAHVPRDFALNQDLSPFALAAIDLLDPTSSDYALDLISVIEATLEDPRPILWAQERAAKAAAVAEMKADGLEYHERMARLDEISWPKPLAELLAGAFDIYARANPWTRDFELSPKSVVRFAAERAMTFSEIIATFDLQRSEGVVLRYLSDAYRALRSTVPPGARTEEFEEIVAWLGAIVRTVDASLMTEWTAAAGQEGAVAQGSEASDEVAGLELVMLRRLVRTVMFNRLELAQFERWAALGALDERWPASWWRRAFDRYFDEHADIPLDAQARSGQFFELRETPTAWHVTQVIDDPEGHHDWRLVATIDPVASATSGDIELVDLDLVRL